MYLHMNAIASARLGWTVTGDAAHRYMCNWTFTGAADMRYNEKMSLRGKCTGLGFISLALSTKFSLSKSLQKVSFLEVL